MGYIGDYKKLYDYRMNIVKEDFEYIADMIRFVLTKEISSIQLLIGKDRDTLFSINNRNSIEIINANLEQIDLIQKLVTQEGLYLRKYIEE